MARVWFCVDGFGLMPVDLPDKRLDEIVRRGHVEIRLTLWKGAYEHSGSALIKICSDEPEPKNGR